MSSGGPWPGTDSPQHFGLDVDLVLPLQSIVVHSPPSSPQHIPPTSPSLEGKVPGSFPAFKVLAVAGGAADGSGDWVVSHRHCSNTQCMEAR